MKLSLCLTTMNRPEMTMESFSKVYDHPLIDEVVIVDDASTKESQNKLIKLCVDYEYSRPDVERDKITIVLNEENLGMSRNKAKAISEAKNEWVIIFDSDNILYPEYLDSLWNEIHTETETACGVLHGFRFDNKIIYCPSFAEPDYDFSQLPNHINSENAKYLLHIKEFRIFCNTCNYIVNKDQYLATYQYDETIRESDTIHFNYLWLRAGGAFKIVPGMRYFHRRHEGSGWLRGDQNYNLLKAAELQEKIKNL